MTTQELYAYIGGNYDRALTILRSDRMISRFIQKLTTGGVCENLLAAGQSMDPTALFETAHAVKGVCANLGMDNLGGIASELSEEFRPGTARSMSDEAVQARLREFEALYERAKEGLRLFAG